MEYLNFTNDFLRHLPVDEGINTYRQISNACYTRVQPSPVENPRIVGLSQDALGLLGLGPETEGLLDFLSGNQVPSKAEPVAHCYCGHQYGIFSGQLGDGAVITLGAVTNKKEEVWEVQLKGSGKTPLSRTMTDGRKVLRSSIREFLASEAMYYLGVPTTRAISVVTSDTTTSRDIMYKGEISQESCAVVLRLAKSFHRVGSLQICDEKDAVSGMAGPSAGNPELLKTLLDYIINTYYPQIHSENKYSALLDEVIKVTAELVAKWQCLGFCHGVLNTDNISLLGLTLDYGPFAFMETYDPDHICNGSDYWGRHSYRRQPEISTWCLHQMALSLRSLVDKIFNLDEVQKKFSNEFEIVYLSLMRQKLGLWESKETDGELQRSLFILQMYPELITHMQGDGDKKYFDWLNQRPLVEKVKTMTAEDKKAEDEYMWLNWLKKYVARLMEESHISSLERVNGMNRCNPRFVLKNDILQKAIAAAEADDFSYVTALLKMISQPYSGQPGFLLASDENELDLMKKMLKFHDSTSRGRRLRITCSS